MTATHESISRQSIPRPSRPWTVPLAWALGGLTVALLLASAVLAFLNRNAEGVWLVADPVLFLTVITYGTVGTLLALRRPGNALGWLYLAIALSTQVSLLASHWAVYGLVTAPPKAGSAGALWWGLALSAMGLALAPTFQLLLFPSGRLIGWFARIVAAVAALATVQLPIALITGNEAPPGFPSLFAETPNPLAPASPIGDPFLSIAAIGLCGILSVGLLFVRFRRSRAEQRQQYKWIVFALAMVIFTFFLDTFLRVIGSRLYVIAGPALSLAVALVPVAVGIAILRNRLFNIDLIIRRTLIYAPLTAIIAGGCAAAIKLFETLFENATGGGSILVVIVTTLLLGAAFTPVQHAMQAALDRRFKAAPAPPTPAALMAEPIAEPDRLTAGIIDPADLLAPFLVKSVTAYEAKGGAVSLFRDGGFETVHTHGEFDSAATRLTIVLPGDHAPLGLLALGPRPQGAPYNAEDRAALQAAADRVARAIALVGAGARTNAQTITQTPASTTN